MSPTQGEPAASSGLRNTALEERPGSSVALLVFDLDGTLIDSSADLCSSVNAALRHVGRLSLPALQIAGFIGDGAETLMRRALRAGCPGSIAGGEPGDDLFTAAFSYFLSYYRLHKLDSTKPYPGVLKALEQLRSSCPDLPMAVLTNKPVRPAREICSALGLAPYFFAIYGGDSFPKKPAPDGLRSIMREAGLVPHQHGTTRQPIRLASVVMVGDSPIDVQTARNCGVRSLGCSYGLEPEALALAEPDLLSAHPQEWQNLLGL